MLRPADTLVVVDEAHHLGEDLAWGASFRRAFASVPRWLLLSGTPFRSDATPIPGVRYDREGLAVPDVSYTYAEAVADGVCRPVAFVTFDGTLSWRSGEDVIESSFETVLTAREASRRYRTAISTELPDGLPRILREANAMLRAEGHRDAGGLAVAANATHARRIAKLLGEVTGRTPVVVLHTDADAARKLQEFRGSREPWIVAVRWSPRASTSPGFASASTRPPPRRPSSSARSSDGSCARSPAGQPSRAGCIYPPSRPCAPTPPRSKRSYATRSTTMSPKTVGRSRPSVFHEALPRQLDPTRRWGIPNVPPERR